MSGFFLRTQTAAVSALLAAVLLLSACAAPTAIPAQVPPLAVQPTRSSRLTEDILKNARYQWPDGDLLQLVDGKYEYAYGSGATQVVKAGFLVAGYGDLNGDGVEDAAVIVWKQTGGTGTFYYLIAMVDQDGAPRQAGVTLLGDRVQIQTVAIQNGQIAVDLLGGQDAGSPCCSSQQATRLYVLDVAGLKGLGQSPTTPQSPSGLTGDTITSVQYNLPDVGTFQLQDGKWEKKYGDGATQVYQVELQQAAFGDLNGDGAADAVVQLWLNTGGTGSFIYLVAIVSHAGGAQQAAATLLGDRVQVKTLAIENGQITVMALGFAPGDPQCCPSAAVTRIYHLGATLDVVSEVPAPGQPTAVPAAEIAPDLLKARFDTTTYQCANEPQRAMADRIWQMYAAPEGGKGGDPLAAGQSLTLNLRDKLGDNNQRLPARAMVIAPDGTAFATEALLDGTQWTVVSYPGSFSGTPVTVPGTYTVLWLIQGQFVACSGFEVR